MNAEATLEYIQPKLRNTKYLLRCTILLFLFFSKCRATLGTISPAGAASSGSITRGIVAEHHTVEYAPLFVRSKEKRGVHPDFDEFCIFDGPVQNTPN